MGHSPSSGYAAIRARPAKEQDKDNDRLDRLSRDILEEEQELASRTMLIVHPMVDALLHLGLSV